MPVELDDATLERKLFSPPFGAGEPVRPQPDWAHVHVDVRRPNVTLLLVWEEYRGGRPDGYGYSPFCDLYAAWRGRLSPTMRQIHPSGERMFVDYAGQTVEVIDSTIGEVRLGQIGGKLDSPPGSRRGARGFLAGCRALPLPRSTA